MKFTLENQFLNGAVTLMKRIPLSGYQSVARTRFVKLFKEPGQAYLDAQSELIKQYGLKDEDGKQVMEGESYKLQPSKIKDYQKANEKLLSEKAEIDKGTYTSHEADIQDILKNCKLQLSGDEATIYAALCDALKVDFGKEDK